VLFGTAYYQEYHAVERLDDDIELMLAAGMNYVRVGESTWSLWEPADGDFRFEWLARVVDRCHEAGLASIIGTPTYAIPAWLARRYPEILAHTTFGRSAQFGTRQNVDIGHAAYLFHAERVIREVVGHFASHPGVIGWQVDNETGVHVLHNPDVRQRFADHLKASYGTVEALNAAWGSTHWSLTLGDWADLWPDANNSSPGYDLDWRRFQSGLTTEFLAWQSRIVRDLARTDQFITHCSVGGHAVIRPAADSRAVTRVVDIPAINPYYTTQATLTLPDPHGYEQRSAWHPGTGVWAIYLQADMARADPQQGFLVLETNASNAGYPHENYPAWDGQWRQAAYALAARGARGIGYWHWHSCHAGKEIYWRGILGHDYHPGRCYDELAAVGAELGVLGELFESAIPDADVAFLHSKDSEYALAFLPPLADPVTNQPLAQSYTQIFDTFYRGYFDAQLQAVIVDTDAAFIIDGAPRWPVLCVPAGYVMSDELGRRLSEYARAGGHLLLTFRTAYADEHGRARTETPPGPLAEVAGIHYRDFTNLREPVAVRAGENCRFEIAGALAHGWADMVELDTAEMLLGYTSRHLSRYAAVSTNRTGAGRVTWVGTLPSHQLAKQIAMWSATVTGYAPAWTDVPESVRIDTATLADGRRIAVVANWADDAAVVPMPMGAVDARTGQDCLTGDALELAPRDTVVLVVAQHASAHLGEPDKTYPTPSGA
jgi:beta-galactosidase